MKKIARACLVTTLLVSGCSLGDSNDNKGSSKVSDDNHQSSKKNNESQHKGISNEDNNINSEQQNTYSDTYYSKVWLTALDSYRNNNDIQFDDLKIQHADASGKLLDPYHPKESARFPEGTELLSASVSAAGAVFYKNNGDGTITIYNFPSQFQGSWRSADYSKKESQRIIDEAQTVKLYDASDSEINQISVLMSSESTSYGDPTDTKSNSENDDHLDNLIVTRSNVIDLVEEYEGHKLDTSMYTYKEPEKGSDGNWGFTFTDKDGHLAGSYIIDQDGVVTKYDGNGDEE